MASTSASHELARALPRPFLTDSSLLGRLRVLALRLAADLPHSRQERYFWPALAFVAFSASYLATSFLHEVLVVAVAVLLPPVTNLPLVQDVIAASPVNFIYFSAMVRYAGQIEVSGFAVAGNVGVVLADWWPAVFYDPSYVDGDGVVSAVMASGSSLLARTLVATVANCLVLGAGVLAIRRALRGVVIGLLSELRGPRLVAVAASLALQVEVAARVVRAAGSTRDLETLGVVPFLLHEVMRLHREVYDLVMFQLSRLLDPVFGEVVLFGLVVLVTPLFWRRRLVVEASLVAMLFATLPLWDGITSDSRFLEMENIAASSIPLVAEPVLPSDFAPNNATSVAPVEEPEPAVTRSEISMAPLDPPMPPSLGPPVAGVLRALALPPLVRPTKVAIGGRGLKFSYVVDGVPTEFRGMGLNVTYAGMPPAERAQRLARDFQAMKQVGVNVVVGWRTVEWDEAVLDAAQAAGIGVVMPYELDDKLDYSDRNIRLRTRAEILAWVARYRGHPAIRMWGIGNEALLHVKQPARAQAFGQFYVQMVDVVRQFDPDHPVLYREAEDVYVKWLQDAWGKAGPPPGFVLGMNFYTFRMDAALKQFPSRGLDVPLVISEFAPAGLGRGERAAGYWKMWNMIRARPELVLGAAPYVWNAEGPEPVDRLFGLTSEGKAVDSTLGTLKELYQSTAQRDETAPIVAPALVGLSEFTAERVVENLGLAVGSVAYQRATELSDPTPLRRYGIGNVIFQEPPAGTPLARGAEVRIAVAAAALQPEVRARPVAD